MPENVNRQFILKSRPAGMPKESDFDLVESEIPSPEFGQVLVKSLWMSLDPYMRGRITSSPVGDVIESESVGRVMESRLDGIEPGDIVRGALVCPTTEVAKIFKTYRLIHALRVGVSTVDGF